MRKRFNLFLCPIIISLLFGVQSYAYNFESHNLGMEFNLSSFSLKYLLNNKLSLLGKVSYDNGTTYYQPDPQYRNYAYNSYRFGAGLQYLFRIINDKLYYFGITDKIAYFISNNKAWTKSNTVELNFTIEKDIIENLSIILRTGVSSYCYEDEYNSANEIVRRSEYFRILDSFDLLLCLYI